MPNRLVENLPIWKTTFVLFLSFDMALSSILPDSLQSDSAFSELMFLAVFIASVFILSGEFIRRVGSGKRQLHLNEPLWGLKDGFSYTLYRGYLPFTRYVAVLIVALAASGLFAGLVDALLPSFSSDQNTGLPEGNLWVSIGGAFLGCLEEYWRWSMIVSVLLLIKWFVPTLWKRRRGRNTAFWVAVFASSLVFGLAHYQEFSEYKGWSYVILGIMGLMLALIAIVTRRFLVAVAVHYVYDFLAMSNLFDEVNLVLYFVAGVIIVLVGPTFPWLLRKVWPELNVSAE